MQPAELEERIAAFPRWHYRFQFDGGIETPVARIGQINRHEQRRRYFFDALLEIAGGTLEGLRVLDLGCNAGLWSLNALESGAQFVLGIDRHPPYVEQAELVFEAKGIDRSRYRFEHGGHLPPRVLRELRCGAVPGDHGSHLRAAAAVRAVRLGRGGDRGDRHGRLAFARRPRSSSRAWTIPQDRAEQLRVLLPSPRAVLELARDHGYGAVALAHNMTDYSGMDDYRERRRMAFVCARGSRAGRPWGARRQARHRGAVAELADAPAGPRTAQPLGRLAPRRRVRDRPRALARRASATGPTRARAARTPATTATAAAT